jgi:hypothetical protein
MTTIPQPVLDYLDSSKTMTLATATPEGVPHAATFMYANNGATLYFWARTSSTTVGQLRSNPNVSFTIDEYVADWNKAKGIQGAGKCTPVTGDELVDVLGLLADKFPSPSSNASTANVAFFKVAPSSLRFIDNEGGNVKMTPEEFGIDFHREDVIFSD